MSLSQKLLLRYQTMFVAPLTMATLVDVTMQLMGMVEEDKLLSGVQKKQIVLEVMTLIAEQIATDEDPVVLQLIEQTILQMIPVLIDRLVEKDGRVRSSLFACCS